jgi:hypothetical protein
MLTTHIAHVLARKCGFTGFRMSGRGSQKPAEGFQKGTFLNHTQTDIKSKHGKTANFLKYPARFKKVPFRNALPLAYPPCCFLTTINSLS